MVNYEHLHYFWAMVREGGVARASERLYLTSQTIGGQLSLLEEYLVLDLFAWVGCNLEFTENGRLVLSYADQICSAMIDLTSWLVPGNKTDLGG